MGWSHAATENPQGGQQIFVNGQHFSGTGFELDGTDNQDPILGIIVVNPNLDAITETKMSLQNYDAEFGKAIAGLVTVQTKSGSNEVHGSAFWFRRTDATQARDPFTQYKPDAVTGRLIPSSRWNQFGGSLGGPIVKNKLFFFGDYQGTRQASGISQQLTIPTALSQASCNPATNASSTTPGFCNLSEYLGQVPGGGQVYDPTTGNQLDGSGRAPFVGNLIPIGRIPSQSAAVFALFPQPTNGNVHQNFVGAGSGPFNQNSFDTRIDFNPNEKLQVFGRFSLDYFSLSGKGVLGQLGGVGFGLTQLMTKGAITLADGRVEQRNFDGYAPPYIIDAPVTVDVHPVTTDRLPLRLVQIQPTDSQARRRHHPHGRVRHTQHELGRHNHFGFGCLLHGFIRQHAVQLWRWSKRWPLQLSAHRKRAADPIRQ